MSWTELSVDGGVIIGIATCGGAFCAVTIGAGFGTLVARGTVYDASFDGELSAAVL